LATELCRELWFEGPYAVTLRAARSHAPGPGEVRVRATHSAISRGTELLLYRGEGPTPFDPSLEAAGAPIYPRRYGYAWVGRVVELGAGAPAALLGARIFGLLPHGDEHVLPAERLLILPDALPSPRATLIPQVETALTALWDAQVVFRQRVVVLGGGLIGLLIARLAQQAGAAQVHLIEAQPTRRELAQRFGILLVNAPEEVNPKGDADIVFEVSGHPEQVDVAIEHCAQEASILVVSFYGARVSPVQLGSTFHRRRLQLKSSQVSHVPPSLSPRWSHARRLHSVLRLLEDPVFDTLLSAPQPFANASDVYAQLDERPTAEPCTLFRYDELDAGAPPK